ncbi:chemoreceptor glutamine deamidase CheD [Noviherbaspirillum pedocola]|uniref:Probable chemoreceptor glutamine deamidase CheD n=1 Tax=Noviherbaspirillum pedocola TaxID=2801341 RepID=A0A934SVJ1_9BURK|nr:chemoreceptor glutamine deamidase CheD [Noviherbaspirillum pedocola]MBK4736128.1 chemoreceptor glutamine deamidase CheD [Noviherbaspirillum pedocola]
MKRIAPQPTSNIYWDHRFSCDTAKLLPGEYFGTDRDMMIVTVLGSCVAACLRDRVSGVGGMNHFLLPEDLDGPAALAPSPRYGNFAMEALIIELLRLGACRENLEAKVFGGGNVISGLTAVNVGERNAAFVKAYLHEQKIPVVAEDLNDVRPRKVHFFPRTGRVLVKSLGRDTPGS